MNDLRFALKSLRRSPGFTLIAILTLGLGIGANTSMFSLLNGYLLRPAPYPDRDRLDRIYRATPQDVRGGVSSADYLDLRAQAGGYGEIAAYGDVDMSLAEPGKPAERVDGLRVSANLFSTLGATTELGRSFRPDEEIAGNHRVLMIGHRYWKNRFGGDPHIVGRTVRVDGEPHEIVGVLPATFSDWRHLNTVDVFRPLALSQGEARDRSATWLRLVGRRPVGVSQAQGEAFVAGFGRRLKADFPATNIDDTWRLVPIDASFLPGNGRVVITMLVGLSGFVLLIACSNLANLMLARTMARAREFAVRSALGASGAQMLRPLFVESLLLAFAGGLCALFVALWSFDWFAVASAGDNGVGVDIGFDWRVLAWTFGACLFTAVAFGVVPALFARRLDLNGTLKSGSRGTTGDRGHQRFRNALIVGQFALAMVLLAGAVLFTRGLHELNNRRAGWESEQLVTGSMLLPSGTYPGPREIADFQRRALESIEALPGVASASVSYSMPFFAVAQPRKYLVEGREAPEHGHEPAALVNGVSARYFETVKTRLIAGRAFGAADSLDAPRVFIVNEAMARGLFGSESPIGRRVGEAGGDTVAWGEIVGVVVNVQSVSDDPNPVTYQLYQPMAQEPQRSAQIAVRATGIAPASLVESIRTAMAALDGDLPVWQLQPADTAIVRVNYQFGVLASVLTALATLGLGLATLGIYAVISRTTAQRRTEFGIRLAVGAQAGDITRLVLTSGARLALIGSGIGLLGAFGVARVYAMAFPGMHTNSVALLIATTLLLIAIAQLAAYIPARNASRTSLTETLRAD